MPDLAATLLISAAAGFATSWLMHLWRDSQGELWERDDARLRFRTSDPGVRAQVRADLMAEGWTRKR